MNKRIIEGIIAAIGAAITTLFGGWSTGLTTLIFFMAADYISGIVVAAIFKNSNKSESGALDSKAGWKGLSKKGMTLLFVLIAYRLDLMIGTTYIRDAVIIGNCLNELLSIIENAGLMGVPLPGAIKKAVDILIEKEGNNGDNK